MSKRLSSSVRFFIDKGNCKKGSIVNFVETSRNENGVMYQIITNTNQVISFYLSFFNLVKDSPDKLFIGRAAVAEAIASDLTVDYIPNEIYFKTFPDQETPPPGSPPRGLMPPGPNL